MEARHGAVIALFAARPMWCPVRPRWRVTGRNELKKVGLFRSLVRGDPGGRRSRPRQTPVAPTCFMGTPSTHDQIINACVDQSVTVIHKMPVLPLLNSDGTLPPLP